MSRYVVATNEGVVVIGHERQLSYFFLQIGKGGEWVYSNMMQPDPAMNITQIIEELKKHKIEAPEWVRDLLQHDEIVEDLNGQSLQIPKIFNSWEELEEFHNLREL